MSEDMRRILLQIGAVLSVVFFLVLYENWSTLSEDAVFLNYAPTSSPESVSIVTSTTQGWSKIWVQDDVIIEQPIPDPENNGEYIRVNRVIDGDTIELETGEKVRYIGVNTPESVDPRRTVQCFGKEAAMFNKQLVEGQLVRLEADVGDADKYHRLLRYVFLEDGTFVNEHLVAQGYATVMTVPPNVSHVELFLTAQTQARQQQLGLWSRCKK